MKYLSIFLVSLFMYSCGTNCDKTTTENADTVVNETELSVKDIWKNYLSAIDKDGKLKEIKTYREVSVTNSPEGTVTTTTEVKRPDKMVQTIVFSDATTKCVMNGKMGSFETVEGIISMKDADFLRFRGKLEIIPEFYLEKNGYELKLLGKEKIGEKEFYKIRAFQPTEQNELIYFIDTQNYTLAKMSVNINTLIIKEYCDVEGIKLVKKSELKHDTEAVITEFSYEFNIELDDAIFTVKE